MTDDDEAWWDSEECAEIKDRGLSYYLNSYNRECTGNEDYRCIWEEGTREYDAWYDGYRRWGN